MMLVANRNVTVRSTTGHVIKFTKDEPVSVPRMMVSECMAVGIVPVDDDYTPEEPTKNAIPTGHDREQALRDAIIQLKERNDRGDFTGGGRPDLRALFGILGWRPDQYEVQKLWKQMREEWGSEE